MSDDMPTFLSLFAGIGGFDLALERVGFGSAGQVEIDAFCQRILAARFPHAPRWADCREFTGDRLQSPVDLLVGGFPCQGASIAGKRLGLADDRTALFWEIIRIQKIIRAPWALLENVPGLRSVRYGRDFATCLAALKELWPVVGWRTLDSRYFGVAQRRARVFFVCGPDEARVAQVLFEPEGGGGDSAESGETGAHVARSLAVGAGGPGYRYDPNGEEFVIARPLKGGGNDRHDESHETYIADTLNSGGNSSGFRTEPGAHIVPAIGFAWQSGGDVRLNPKEEESSLQANQVPAVAYQQHGTNVGEMGVLRKGSGGVQGGVPFVAHALSAEGADACEDGTGRGTPLVISGRDRGDDGRGYEREPNISDLPALDTIKPDRVAVGSIVRRLTPTECARLQGFPDGWCCECQPLEAWAADPETAAERCACPDSPQYRAYGNAVTVNVIEWLGRRLTDAMNWRPAAPAKEGER